MRKETIEFFKTVSEETGENRYFRTIVSVYLFDFLDRLRMDGFRGGWFQRLKSELERLVDFFHFSSGAFEWSLNDFSEWNREDGDSRKLEEKTGEVYYRLWKDFNKEEYYSQAFKYINERFSKNSVSVNNVKIALDDGCGGGRYTLALKQMGCRRVIGVDVACQSIALAKRMNSFNSCEVDFLQGSVLDLPFNDGVFDFVFSNGVLHHTSSTENGLQEIYRVLRNGGDCWLYLYGGKESLFWDIVDFCRSLLDGIPQAYTQDLMRILGYPPGRIFHRTDFFYVPVNRRYFSHEVENMIRDTGFSDFRRLTRGIEYDWDEIIHDHPDIDPYIYGEGEMRYLVSK